MTTAATARPSALDLTIRSPCSSGSLFVISTFYKKSELAARTSFFFIGSTLATSTTGLLAYGILPLGDKHPQLHGWQWLMISKSC